MKSKVGLPRRKKVRQFEIRNFKEMHNYEILTAFTSTLHK